MTATTSQETAAVASTPSECTITASGTIAVLPAAVLWAVAKAASRDMDKKGRLCTVDVRRSGDDRIRILATDGYRVFRCYVRNSDHFFISADQTAPFRLDPAAFRKTPTMRGAAVSIDSNGMATFCDRGGKASLAAPWQPDVRTAGDYPETDQLWPSPKALTCNPGKFVAMSGRYLADVAEAAAQLGTCHCPLKMYSTQDSLSPVYFIFNVDPAWMLAENTGDRRYPKYECEDTTIEYLLMPVQVR